MKEFLLILLFGKSILLTPEPIMLENVINLVPEKPISAITSGASLEIEVSNIIKKDDKEGILEFRERVKELFPANFIKANLIQKDGKKISLTYTGAHSFNDESTLLSLYSHSGVPIDIEFEKVVLTSKISVENVQIYWKNYKH